MDRGGPETGAIHTTARWVSDMANPLFIPPVIFLLTGYLTGLPFYRLLWLGSLSLFFYTLVPLTIAVAMLRAGTIASLDIPKRESRNRLYLNGIASSLAGSLLIGILFIQQYPFLTMVAGIFGINPIIGYLLNRVWKISIHSASVASGSVILVAFYYWNTLQTVQPAIIFVLVMLILLLPVMMWSRFKLKIHTLPELLGGTFAGILFTAAEIIVTFYYWRAL